MKDNTKTMKPLSIESLQVARERLLKCRGKSIEPDNGMVVLSPNEMADLAAMLFDR